MPSSSSRQSEAAARKREAATRKREAAKRKAEKKREKKKAAIAKSRAKKKAALERERAKKKQEAKRKRIKDGKPLLYIYSYDLRSGEALPATHIQVQEVNARPGKKPKISKPTDKKYARVSRGLPVGDYWAYASKTGYFPSDTVFFTHREDEDSVRILLYPETRMTFTVTDSFTSRPVVANIIVRNHRKQKVMQTTSDSLHSVLAVLLDDRIPFYTIDATAVDYYPYHTKIADYTKFKGVVMSPREIKSFVLHNIYFVTGKTRILESSEKALKELYNLLSSRPSQRIRIVGHTDDIGSDRSNQSLSEGRCDAVRQAMVSRGVAPDRIEIEGRGERDPIMPNDTEEHRQMNRRVEIVLL